MDSHLLQKMVKQTFELVDEAGSTEEPAHPFGVSYALEIGKGSFRLKGEACFYEKAKEKDGEKFFSTSRPELAEVIVDQLFNRRFPLDEKELCNISDPGESWWMLSEGAHIYIYFGGHYFDEKINLGPMGDVAVAYALLKRGEAWLRRLFPIKDFSLTSKCLALSALDPKHRVFQQFCNIFSNGEEPVHPSFGTSALSLYLDELAAARRFWCHLQDNMRDS